MEFENVIRGRRSIRAYTSQPVPEDLVREILDEARWAPSSRNTQAWSVWVVTGDALERFKAAFKAALGREEADASDLAGTDTGDWPQACSARAVELMKTRAETMEAAGEASGPAASMARMADCFGAPVLLVFGFEACLAAGVRQLRHGLARAERVPRRSRQGARHLPVHHAGPVSGPVARAAARLRRAAHGRRRHARLPRPRRLRPTPSSARAPTSTRS